VIRGAQVKLTNGETNETRTVVSGEDGEYWISSLKPGSYSLQTEASGFMKSVLIINPPSTRKSGLMC
jgi:hypothetical protein